MELTKLPKFGLSLYRIAFRGTASHDEPRQLAATSLAPRLACLTKADSLSRELQSWHTDLGELA
jgi:HrpA-like RNA helicase